MKETAIASAVGELVEDILATGETAFLYSFEVHEDFHRLLVVAGTEYLSLDLPAKSHEDWLDAHAFFFQVAKDAGLFPEYKIFLPDRPKPRLDWYR